MSLLLNRTPTLKAFQCRLTDCNPTGNLREKPFRKQTRVKNLALQITRQKSSFLEYETNERVLLRQFSTIRVSEGVLDGPNSKNRKTVKKRIN